MLLIRCVNPADEAGGPGLKHRSLRQTRLLSWEPSRRGACSRLADGTRSVGAATDSIDLEQKEKKKGEKKGLPQCSSGAAGHSSSFQFATVR